MRKNTQDLNIRTETRPLLSVTRTAQTNVMCESETKCPI